MFRFKQEPNQVVILIGFSGSGKSYIAKFLEKYGYKVLRSDVIRKELAGLKPTESAKAPFGKGIYSEDMTEKVYKEMVKRAKDIVAKGGKVVLDASFLKRWQRELVLRNFPTATFLWAVAPDEVIIERLKKRKGDVSDADVSVFQKQKKIFESPTELLRTFIVKSDNLEILKDILGLI
jgi:gluconokinase